MTEEETEKVIFEFLEVEYYRVTERKLLRATTDSIYATEIIKVTKKEQVEQIKEILGFG